MEEKPITNRESQVHQEDTKEVGGKIINLYIEKKDTEPEKISLEIYKEISKPLSDKIDKYEKQLEKLGG